MILTIPNFAVLNLALVASVFAAVAILFYLLLGLLRGGERAGLRLGVVAVDALVSYLFVRLIGHAMLMPRVIALIEQQLDAGDAETVGALLTASSSLLWAIAAPIVFFAFFLLFGLVLWLLYVIFALIFFPKKRYRAKAGSEPRPRRRGLGAVLGALTGVLVFVSLNLPFYGYETLAADHAAAINEVADNGVSVAKTTGFGTVLARLCGSGAVFDSMTSVRIGEERIPLVRELGALGDVGAEIYRFAQDGVPDSPDAYIAVADKLTKTRILPVLLKLSVDSADVILSDPKILTDLEGSLSPDGVAALRNYLTELSDVNAEELVSATALGLRVSRYALADNPTAAEGRTLGEELAADRLWLSTVKNGAALCRAIAEKDPDADGATALIVSVCEDAEAAPAELLRLAELTPAVRAFMIPPERWDDKQIDAVDEVAGVMERSALLRSLAADFVGLVKEQMTEERIPLLTGILDTMPSALETHADEAIPALADLAKVVIRNTKNGQLDASGTAGKEVVECVVLIAIGKPVFRTAAVEDFNRTIDLLSDASGLPEDRRAKTHITASDLNLTKEQTQREVSLFGEILDLVDSGEGMTASLAAKLNDSAIFGRAVTEIVDYNAEQFAKEMVGDESIFDRLPAEAQEYAKEIAEKKKTFDDLPEDIKRQVFEQFEKYVLS